MGILLRQTKPHRTPDEVDFKRQMRPFQTPNETGFDAKRERFALVTQRNDRRIQRPTMYYVLKLTGVLF